MSTKTDTGRRRSSLPLAALVATASAALALRRVPSAAASMVPVRVTVPRAPGTIAGTSHPPPEATAGPVIVLEEAVKPGKSRVRRLAARPLEAAVVP